MGQVVVRSIAWLILVASVFTGPRPEFGSIRPVLIILLFIIALPLLQLTPLPPEWWQELPGRDVLIVPGESSPWRPLTMTPGATRNALASLIIPTALLILVAQADSATRSRLLAILLTMVCSAVLVGFLQFSGIRFNNPMINDIPGHVSGTFANRNHFALFVAIGCLLVPVWALQDRAAIAWRAPVAIGLIPLFILTILATGSRSGILLAALALILALALVGRHLYGRSKHLPIPLLISVAAAGLLTIGSLVFLSFVSDRAESLNRFVSLNANDDLRIRALPTLLEMIKTYFPFGSGLGGFDPLFRIHEPVAMLDFKYFNQAHNEYLGLALDGGVAALAILAAAIAWWLIATIRVWRSAPSETVTLARLGSSILLLVFIASATDYPVRTPLVMTVVVIAAIWLSRGRLAREQAPLPRHV